MALREIAIALKKSYQQTSQITSLAYRIKVFKILFRLHRKCYPGSPPGSMVTETIFGYKVSAASYEHLLNLFVDIVLKRQYHFISSKSAPKIIDCRANIGMMTLFYKVFYPRSLILAFEPDPDAFKLLEKNLKQNKIRNVKTFNACLSQKNLIMRSRQVGDLLYGSMHPKKDDKDSTEVRSVKLSDLLSNDVYDVVRIDVGGGEWEIINDLQQTNTLRNAHHYIIGYHHQANGQSFDIDTFLNIFQSHGFQYNIRSPHYENGKSSGDVVVYFENENSKKTVTEPIR